MKLYYQKRFKKQYHKLSLPLQKKTDSAILLFQKNPYRPRLKNHPLRGSLKGKRAISITGDVRIIFEEHGDYTLVIMIYVGTHPQVYK